LVLISQKKEVLSTFTDSRDPYMGIAIRVACPQNQLDFLMATQHPVRLISEEGQPPVYEAESGSGIVPHVLDFLSQEALPEALSLSWLGTMLVFRSRQERACFVLGFEMGQVTPEE